MQRTYPRRSRATRSSTVAPRDEARGFHAGRGARARRTRTAIGQMELRVLATHLAQLDHEGSRRRTIVDVKPSEHARDRDGLDESTIVTGAPV
jgi:hypothetical protein